MDFAKVYIIDDVYIMLSPHYHSHWVVYIAILDNTQICKAGHVMLCKEHFQV